MVDSTRKCILAHFNLHGGTSMELNIFMYEGKEFHK